MARLIDPGLGEICDRLTILSLKILHGGQRGKRVEHFTSEQTALLQQVRSRTLNAVWFDKVLELAAVNAALWQAEDQLRAYRQDAKVGAVGVEALWEDAAICAFRIQELNDQRAGLIKAINQDVGDSNGEEKL